MFGWRQIVAYPKVFDFVDKDLGVRRIIGRWLVSLVSFLVPLTYVLNFVG